MNELKSADGTTQPMTEVCGANLCPAYVPVTCEYLGCSYQPKCQFTCGIYL